MVQPLNYFKETASQTAGPYVHIGCTPNFVGIEGVFEKDLGSGGLYNDKARGERISVRGTVYDGAGMPLKDALIEIWQADTDGYYWFKTIQPGAYPWPNGVNDWRPAHIHFSVFGHGFAQRLITQMYFEGDPLIWKCPIVKTIPDEDAIRRLIAPLDMNATLPMDMLAYKFDIVLRGRRSTLFENRMEGN